MRKYDDTIEKFLRRGGKIVRVEALEPKLDQMVRLRIRRPQYISEFHGGDGESGRILPKTDTCGGHWKDTP